MGKENMEMTYEQAIDCNKNLKEFMKITDKTSEYKFLEDNYIALDMAIKALQAQADWENVFKGMRDCTPEEQASVDKYIKSISKPIGVNVFDFYEDNEQEELDFVQPKKTIPCTIKVKTEKSCRTCKNAFDNNGCSAQNPCGDFDWNSYEPNKLHIDDEYVSKKALKEKFIEMGCYDDKPCYGAEILDRMPSVAIPIDGKYISYKKVNATIHNHMFDNAHRPTIYAELKRISKELDGLSVAIPTNKGLIGAIQSVIDSSDFPEDKMHRIELMIRGKQDE